MEQSDKIPEPLRGFMRSYLNPELYGSYWNETIQSAFDSDPEKATRIREQFRAAMEAHSITPEEYTAVTRDQTGTREELDRWLEILWQRIFVE